MLLIHVQDILGDFSSTWLVSVLRLVGVYLLVPGELRRSGRTHLGLVSTNGLIPPHLSLFLCSRLNS